MTEEEILNISAFTQLLRSGQLDYLIVFSIACLKCVYAAASCLRDQSATEEEVMASKCNDLFYVAEMLQTFISVRLFENDDIYSDENIEMKCLCAGYSAAFLRLVAEIADYTDLEMNIFYYVCEQ